MEKFKASDKWIPQFVVTNRNKVVTMKTLDNFGNAESKQITKDAFSQSRYEKNRLEKPLYDPLIMAKLVEVNTYHMRACSTKAEDVAGQGWTFIPTKEDPDKKQLEVIEELIKSQSEKGLSLDETIKRAQKDKELIGYFDIEIARDGNAFEGPVNLIKHIPGHTVRIHRDGNKFCQIRGRETAWFRRFGYEKDVNAENGAETAGGTLDIKTRGNELIHSIHYTPRSTFYGIPDITPAIGAIAGDISRRDYNIAFFSNYGVPAYVVSISGDFDPGDIDPKTGKTKLQTQIEERFQEVIKNPQSVMILTLPKPQGSLTGSVEVKFEPLSTEIKEASFRLYRTDNRNEVITAHGVPPYRMGIYETGGLAGNIGKESTKIYYQDIIQPRQKVFDDIFNYLIMPSLEITDWRFQLNSIDMEDIDKDIDRVTKLFAVGAITPNQIITFTGDRFGIEKYEDNPAMDLHYIGGQPIDAGNFIPESEITKVLGGIKSKLIEVLIDDISRKSRSPFDRDRRFSKAITDLEKDTRKIDEGREPTIS